MLGRNTALRLAFVTLLTLPSAGRSLAAAPEPQVKPPSGVAQTAPTRSTQIQVCVREVPDLSRYNTRSAGAVLGKFDLTLGSIQPQKSEAAKGTIVGQSVKPGTQVRCGTRIDVYVSDGSSDVRQPPPGDRPQPPITECPVPSLVNHSYAEVRERLRGWTIGRVERVETRAAQEGTVLRQSPAPRTMVKCQSSIDIAIAAAPPNYPAPQCVVPGIESGDVANARQALARRNLVLGSVSRRPSEKSPGTVIGQHPASETTIACGSTVDVWIAVPLPLVRVPSLQGQDIATVRRTLEGAGLALGNAGRRDSELPFGGVVDQLPLAEAEVKPGTAVHVWLSAGVPLVQVPDLRGRDRGTASDILSSQALRLGEVSDRAVDATPGTVVDQQPASGSMVRRDTAVRVWVAASIQVPSVIGRREGDATATLTNHRLRVGTVQTRESSEPAGTVIEQNPQPRRPARLNAPVDLVLAIPITVVVPDLRGRNRQAITAALRDAELQLGATATREVEGPAGVVVEQSPPAGERVELGTAVQVWLAVPLRVQVPDLRGSTRDHSGTLLRARRLVLGSIESRTSVEVPGRIVDQRPAAGTRVEVGTPVTIWIAAPAPPDVIPPQVTPLLEVPDLKGRTRDQALAILADRGLVLGQASTTPSNDTPDTVVSQQPAGATRVPPGTGVAVVLAVPPVPPPNAAAVAPPPPLPVPPPDVPADSPTLLVWLLLGAGIAAALAGFTVKARTRTPRASRPPSITFAPHPDPQMNVELSADGPLTRSELWLRPCRDAGTQTAQGPGSLGMIQVTEMR